MMSSAIYDLVYFVSLSAHLQSRSSKHKHNSYNDMSLVAYAEFS
jgi:hypothetical protein